MDWKVLKANEEKAMMTLRYVRSSFILPPRKLATGMTVGSTNNQHLKTTLSAHQPAPIAFRSLSLAKAG